MACQAAYRAGRSVRCLPRLEGKVNLTLRSAAFNAGDMIDPHYTCDGEDVSPPLSWTGVPEGTKSLALICDDPDAPRGTWSHWVLYNIPPDKSELPEGVPPEGRLTWGAMQGRNDFGNLGYGGPCCPRGSTHRYFFHLYALDVALDDLRPGLTRQQLLDRIQGHILDQTQLMGRYSR